jgi:hypothetical protein
MSPPNAFIGVMAADSPVGERRALGAGDEDSITINASRDYLNPTTRV